jgi:hypothetical protein
MGRACGMYGGKIIEYRFLMWKPEEKIPQGRPRCRWKHTIKVCFNGMGLDITDGIYLTRWRYALPDIGVA